MRLWQSRAARSAIILIGWTLFGLFALAQIRLQEDGSDRGLSAAATFHVLVFYWAWAAVTPWLWARLARRPSTSPLLYAAGAGAVAILAQAALYVLLLALGGEISNVVAAYPGSLIRHLVGNVLTCGVLIGAQTSLALAAERHQRELRTARLEAQTAALESELARVQLDGLTSRLQPHFLFNALNAISTLVLRGDKESANRGITSLSALLRAAIAGSQSGTIPLRDELELVRRYLEIEHFRFGDALQVDISIDQAALDALVPQFILQPLVENAVRHAVPHRPDGARIAVSGAIDAATLTLRVCDNGPGFAQPLRVEGTGIGLGSLRQRLAIVYGGGASVVHGNLAEGGAEVRIDLPLTSG